MTHLRIQRNFVNYKLTTLKFLCHIFDKKQQNKFKQIFKNMKISGQNKKKKKMHSQQLNRVAFEMLKSTNL